MEENTMTYNQAISEDLLKKEINQLKEVQKNAPQKKAKKNFPKLWV